MDASPSPVNVPHTESRPRANFVKDGRGIKKALMGAAVSCGLRIVKGTLMKKRFKNVLLNTPKRSASDRRIDKNPHEDSGKRGFGKWRFCLF